MAADGKVVFEITANDAPLKKSINAVKAFLEQQKLDVEITAEVDKSDVQKSAKEAISAISEAAEAAPVEVPVEPDPTPEWDGVGESVSPDPVEVPIEPNKEPAEQEMPKIKSWFQRQAEDIKKTLKTAFAFSLGATIADAIKSIGSAIKDFAVDSVQVASDLQEVQNVVDVTFGSDAKTIETWAKKANKQFGLTELQAKKYTSTLGAMMKSSGLTGKAITSMSTDLAGLTADMASFYNLDFETAFEKIRSGISGETEPLKQLGINMSVANLEAYALSQGIDTAYESMTQAEQVTLRYNYLMQATSDAQGDFARTSDSLANSQRLLSTNFDTLKANIGEALLPVLNSAVGAINDLFAALTPEVDITGTFDQIEQDYESAVTEINGKEFTALGLIDELERLQAKTSLTSDEQNIWNTTLQKLTETIPEVADAINLQTGEIEGGTKALRDNVEAWAENAKQQAYVTAMQSKFDALAEAQVAAAEAQVDYTASWQEWQASVDQMGTALDDITDAAGLQRGALDYLKEGYQTIDSAMQQAYGLSDELVQAYNDSVWAADALNSQTYSLGETLNEQNAKLDEATARLDAEAAAYEELTGAQAATIQGTQDYTAATEEQIAQLDAVAEALQPLVDYQMEVRDATLAQVENVVSGFDKLEVGSKASIDSMIEGLNSQLAFMDTYASNMQEASRRGVDEGLLASLADGSVESAEYLAAILAGTDEDIQALNEKWQRTQEGKDTFTTVLSDMKLKADAEYQDILNKATSTIADLNMQADATASLSATVQGIVDGINAKAPEVQEAVDNIKGTLKELTYTPSANFGDIWLGRTPGKYAEGLDYVPYDDFPAYLHRGEAVLTADEAQFWRAMGENNVAATSTAPMDYNALAAAVWSQAPQQNISVVLDTGELVGAISTRQGQELQSYQMSKWQPR